MTLIKELFEIRSRKVFSANDITVWLIRVLESFYRVKMDTIRTEVIIRGADPGRADIVVQDLAGFETKRNLDYEIEDAKIQVKRLLKKLEDEQGISPLAVATDGESWKFFILAGNEPVQFTEFKIDISTNEKEFSDNLWKCLTILRVKTNRPDPTAETISEAFRPSGPAFNEIRLLLISELGYLIEKAPIEFTSKFRPWYELFSTVYNNFDERCRSIAHYDMSLNSYALRLQKDNESFRKIKYESVVGGLELFIRHTYLALLAKMLSALATLGEKGIARARVPS